MDPFFWHGGEVSHSGHNQMYNVRFVGTGFRHRDLPPGNHSLTSEVTQGTSLSLSVHTIDVRAYFLLQPASRFPSQHPLCLYA